MAGQVGRNTRQDIDEIIELSNFSGATNSSSFILNGKKPQNPSLRLFLWGSALRFCSKVFLEKRCHFRVSDRPGGVFPPPELTNLGLR
jgi:hypothetical protein